MDPPSTFDLPARTLASVVGHAQRTEGELVGSTVARGKGTSGSPANKTKDGRPLKNGNEGEEEKHTAHDSLGKLDNIVNENAREMDYVEKGRSP